MCFLAKWSVCYSAAITSAFIFCFYLLFCIFMANVGKIRKYRKLEGRLSKRCYNLWNTTKSHNLNSVAYLQNGRVLFFDKVEGWQLSTLFLLKVTPGLFCAFFDEAYNSNIDTLDNLTSDNLFYKCRSHTILIKLAVVNKN